MTATRRSRVNELVRGVNVALNILPIDACPQFDTNGNGGVEVGEIIAAVRAALRRMRVSGRLEGRCRKRAT